jgi:hypothetical protein
MFVTCITLHILINFFIMKINLSKYLINCFWLLLPPNLISLFLAKYLPETFKANIFWNDIPAAIKFFENVLRIVVMALPVFFPLSIKTNEQRKGLFIYGIGIMLYLLSYLLLIYLPESYWSKSLIGFTAPATTPLIWFVGIGLIMDKPFFNIKYSKWIYLILVIAFCMFHFIHASIIYFRHY